MFVLFLKSPLIRVCTIMYVIFLFVHNFKVLIALEWVHGTIIYVLNENAVIMVLDPIPNIVIYDRYNTL